MFRTIYCFLFTNFIQFLKSGGVTKYIFWVCLKDISVPALNMNASRFLGQNKIHETQRNCIIEIWHEDGCNSHWQKNTSTRQRFFRHTKLEEDYKFDWTHMVALFFRMPTFQTPMKTYRSTKPSNRTILRKERCGKNIHKHFWLTNIWKYKQKVKQVWAW